MMIESRATQPIAPAQSSAGGIKPPNTLQKLNYCCVFVPMRSGKVCDREKVPIICPIPVNNEPLRGRCRMMFIQRVPE
jgi:hypothetical protein